MDAAAIEREAHEAIRRGDGKGRHPGRRLGEPDPRAFKAEFLLQDGRLDEASALFEEVRTDTPEDVWLYNQAALAYQGAGDHERALAWITQGLELAMTTGDPEEVVAQLSDIRRVSLKHLGRDLDGLEQRADRFIEERLAQLGAPEDGERCRGAPRDRSRAGLVSER